MKIDRMYQRQLALLGTIVILAGLAAGSDAVYSRGEELIALCEAAISRFPLLGVALFVLLAMTSALLFFFSSAILVPVGVSAWGAVPCLLLLWLGWLLGGVIAFAIGRYLGRSAAQALIGTARLASFENHLRGRLGFLGVLVFQATLPSEIPGYVLGLLRYRFLHYVAALALVELPYAIATVYLSASFLQRQSLLLIIVGAGAVLASLFAYRIFRGTGRPEQHRS
jgi:uncharacterized membrane protein YdjX (TVP38/TMEM64 family)